MIMDDSNRCALIEIDNDTASAPAQAPATDNPSCPRCGHYNAMLSGVCRDCNYSATAVVQAPAPAKKAIGFRTVPVQTVIRNQDDGAMRITQTAGGRTVAQNALPVSPPPAPAVVAPALATWGDDTGIDTEAEARAKASDAVATKAGLRFSSPTLFAWGTRMIGVGVKAHKRARAELHAQPLMSQLAADASALVAKEQRRGDVTTLAQLSYSADDRLRTKAESAGVPVGTQPLKQLMVRMVAPGGGYLADNRLTGELRAPHITHWLDLHRTNEAEARKAVEAARAQACIKGGSMEEVNKALPMPEPKRVKLLSKLDERGERALYGAVGARYPHTYGMDAVIKDVLKGLPGDVRGSLMYDAATTQWRADAALGTEFTPCVGDLHRVGLKFGSHDAGGGSYWASLYAIRVRCVNFTQISAGKKLGRVKHVGSVEALRDRVKALIDVGTAVIQEYSDLWADANQTAIIADAETAGGDARAIFRALIKAGHLPAADGAETAVEHYFNAWLVEPGANRSDYVNAATRAAHEAPWTSPWATDEIEDAASQMVYQHVALNMGQIEAVL